MVVNLFKEKLTSQAKKELERKLNNFDFGSGTSTSDLNLSHEFNNVHFRVLRCEDPDAILSSFTHPA